jgi:ABC-type branched-subunit amino acid transport system substrate-binding protein
MRHRSWALLACGAALLSVGAGSCTTAATSTVSGPLVIYVSDPGGASSDVVRAEELAFDQLHRTVTAFQLQLRVATASKISDNARTAIDDSHAIAYLGEVVPGGSGDSIGITNAQDLLEVSPTDTAAQFTQKVPGMRAPKDYYESFSTYGHTFARVVPTTTQEVAAIVAEMQSLGVKNPEPSVVDSGYGKALTTALAHNPPQGTTSAPTNDAVLIATSSRTAAAAALQNEVSSNPHIKLFVPSALADPAFLSTLSPAVQRALYVSSPAPPPGGDPRFNATHGFTSPQAIFGYAAMQAVIEALRTAGSKANDRATVVGDLIGHSFTSPVSGSFSIDSAGDSNLSSFQIDRFKAGKLVPLKTLQG